MINTGQAGTKGWNVSPVLFGVMGAFLFWGMSLSAQDTETTIEKETRRSVMNVGSLNVGSSPTIQKGKVTLAVRDSSIDYVIRTIAAQARRQIMYKKSDPLFTKRITVNIVNASVLDAFAVALKGTGLVMSVAPDGETIVVHAQADSSTQEKKKSSGVISGHVTDSSTKKPIAGVTVSIQGTPMSALTTERGIYRFPGVAVGTYMVTFRLVGYRSVTQKVVVGSEGMQTVNVVLSPSTTMLSEVVTSVTGTQKKLEIGTDVTTIDVPKVLQTAPISTMTDLLETRVPGLTVIRSSGVPGAPSRLRLRGPSGGLMPNTPGAPNNDPIVIVDGIRIDASQSGVTDQNLVGDTRFPPPSAIDQIDVNSIEKIDVFKGPSATAMYGSDAANGVIVITTKRGQVGRTQWSLTANQDVEYLPGFYAKPGYYHFSDQNCVINATRGLCDANAILSDIYSTGGFLIDSVVRFQALNEPRLTAFGTGSGNALTTSVSGGSQAVTYSITGSTSRKLGLLEMPSLYQDFFRQLFDSAAPGWMRRPNLLRTQNLNASFTIEPRRDLRAMFNVRLTASKQRQSSAQLQLSTLASQYIDTTRDAYGVLGNYATRVDLNQLVSDIALQMNWNRWSFLPLTGTAGFSRMNKDDIKLVPRGVPIGGGSSSPELGKGEYANGIGMTTVQTGQVLGTFLPGGKIRTAMGVQWTNRSSQQYRAQVDSLSDGVVSPAELKKAEQYHRQSVTGGWFVEPRLNLNSRFFVNPGFRFDGGGASGIRSGWRGGFWSLFPKLNFSWIAIDRGDDDPLFGMISMFRPRVAFGVAGVQPAPEWRLRLLNPDNDDGLRLKTLGNTQLGPERTREAEFGGDLELWNNRVTLTMTRFIKVRTDAILERPVARSVTGNQLLRMAQNIGRVRNAGTEVAFSFIPFDHPMFRWTVSGSFSKVTNTLLSLNNGESFLDLGNGTRLVPGYPLFGRWERPILGYSLPGDGGGHLTKSQIVLGDSVVYMGQQFPKFTLPVQMSVSSLKGLLTFNVGFQYEDGMTQMNAGGQALLANVYLDPTSSFAEQAAALAAMGGWCEPRCTQYGVIQTVNTFRFQSFSIGYTVPRTVVQRFGVSTLSFALQGNNLGLWTNYRGKDPNVNSVTVGDAVMDNGQLPTPRTWRFQVRVGG